MTRIAWIDCGSGAAGDMLLAALAQLGAVDPTAIPGALGLEAQVSVQSATRGGLRGMRLTVSAPEDQPRRTWPDIRALLDAADLDRPVRDRAQAVFRRLAVAEAAVHGTSPEDVHFHEVGAVDALVDIVGTCWGFCALHLDTVVATPVALGSGTVRAEHGVLPVPVPAVLRVLAAAAAPSYGGPAGMELCTPTGAALLAEHVQLWGPMPSMVVGAVGTGLGWREVAERPNALRIVLGEEAGVGPVTEEAAGPAPAVLLETNVDDMEGRLWPGVIEALLSAGASDAWLTPILMKKGRPAHMLSVLVPVALAADVRRVVFTHTTTLGLRERPAGKVELERRWVSVSVAEQAIAVKLGLLEGEVVTVQPEWEDVRAAAAELRRAPRVVLAEAVAAYRSLSEPG